MLAGLGGEFVLAPLLDLPQFVEMRGVVWTDDPHIVGSADWIVLPGSKHVAADLAWMRSRRLDGAVRLEVADRGPGVPSELRDRIFDANGAVRRYVNVFVNEEDIRFLQNESTPLKDGDKVVGTTTLDLCDGRCLASIEVGRLPYPEAVAWLGSGHGIGASVPIHHIASSTPACGATPRR